MLALSAASAVAAGSITMLDGWSTLAWTFLSTALFGVAWSTLILAGVGRWAKTAAPGSRLLAACAALGLAAAGGLAYLVFPVTALWWLAPVTAVPAFLLLCTWSEDDEEPDYAGESDGPWAAP